MPAAKKSVELLKTLMANVNNMIVATEEKKSNEAAVAFVKDTGASAESKTVGDTAHTNLHKVTDYLA